MEDSCKASDADIPSAWPAHGLERISRCPVCGSPKRSLLYEGLRDRIFYCAPGEWSLQCCSSCGSAYLDPRPTPDTLSLAYRKYFTHTCVERGSTAHFGFGRRLQRALANGYRNWRFGTEERPASRLGVLAARLLPAQRALIDGDARHLPRAHSGARLLDVGCGNGAFLDFAARAGWQAEGVDPDPVAVDAGRKRGLRVRVGGIEVLDRESDTFDGITLSHVIEHVHDPVALLKSCYRLLKRGGWIWLETPNLAALGHLRYGANWRGLEPPRHLVLFTPASLTKTLRETGFEAIEDQSYRPLCVSIFAASEAIATGREMAQKGTVSHDVRNAARTADRQARGDPQVREFITVKAWKGTNSPDMQVRNER